MLNRYQITSKAGVDFGTWSGETKAHALVAMHQAAGYSCQVTDDDIEFHDFCNENHEGVDRACRLDDWDIHDVTTRRLGIGGPRSAITVYPIPSHMNAASIVVESRCRACDAEYGEKVARSSVVDVLLGLAPAKCGYCGALAVAMRYKSEFTGE